MILYINGACMLLDVECALRRHSPRNESDRRVLLVTNAAILITLRFIAALQVTVTQEQVWTQSADDALHLLAVFFITRQSAEPQQEPAVMQGRPGLGCRRLEARVDGG